MGDPYDQDADTFIIYLGHDAIISDTVTPQITMPCPLHRNAKLARIVHAGKSDLEESPKSSLHLGSVAEKGGMTVRQANWCQCSRWESGRRKKASHHLHPESWAVIREADG